MLKSLTCIEQDENVKSIRYNISNDIEVKKPELHCVVTWNDKNLKGRIKKLKVHFNMYVWGNEIGVIVRDNNGRCYIKNDEYDIFIPSKKQGKFSKIADEVLQDEFSSEFLRRKIFYSSKPDDGLDLFTDHINIKRVIEQNGQRYLTSFEYYPMNHTATLKSTKGIQLNSEMIQESLNMDLLPDYFNEYQVHYINNSNNKDYNIIIPEFITQEKKVDFSVETGEKGIYLIKK